MESGFEYQVTLPLDYDHGYGTTSKAHFHPGVTLIYIYFKITKNTKVKIQKYDYK